MAKQQESSARRPGSRSGTLARILSQGSSSRPAFGEEFVDFLDLSKLDRVSEEAKAGVLGTGPAPALAADFAAPAAAHADYVPWLVLVVKPTPARRAELVLKDGPATVRGPEYLSDSQSGSSDGG